MQPGFVETLPVSNLESSDRADFESVVGADSPLVLIHRCSSRASNAPRSPVTYP